MDPEQLKKLNEMFGLGADAKPEELIAKADEALTKAKTVEMAESQVQKQIAFAEAYPEQHAWILAKQKEERENKATEFAENFTIKLNNRTYVPPVEVREKLRETFLKHSEGEVQFSELQTAIAEAHASDLVELGERGTSSSQDGDNEVAVMSYEDAGVKFAELTREEMKENDKLTQREAMSIVAEKNPQLAQKYYESFEVRI